MQSQKDLYEYHINILSIKMKVKFPCKMKIQHMGSLITGEVGLSDQNRYIFNQQYIFRDQAFQDCIQLTVNLLTEKGAKYIAGAIKLYQSQLIQSEGQKINLVLSKCIDPEAYCEVRVDQIISIKSNAQKHVPYDRQSVVQRHMQPQQYEYFDHNNMHRQRERDRDLSPYHRPQQTNVQYHKIYESKSQFQFPLHQHTNHKSKIDWDAHSKRHVPKSYYKETVKEPRNHPHQISTPYQSKFQKNYQVITSREKHIEAQAYKESYEHLKDRYKKEAENSKNQLNKRLLLQNNENVLKLEIMRLKMKLEEQQKGISQKSLKIKEMQLILTNFQQRQQQNLNIKTQNTKKDGLLKLKDESIKSLSKELEQYKQNCISRLSQDKVKIQQLKSQIELLKYKFQNEKKQLEKDLKTKNQLYMTKQAELHSKSQYHKKQHQHHLEIQRKLSLKVSDYEKHIQNEKTLTESKLQNFHLSLKKHEKNTLLLQEEKRTLQNQLEKFRNSYLKSQYDKKIIHQELQTIKVESNEIKIFKEKYVDLTRTYKVVNEEKNDLENKVQKLMHIKETTSLEIHRQYHDQIQYSKRILKDLEEKNKILSNKIIQLEGEVDISRNNQEKYRVSAENIGKQLNDVKEKQKSNKKNMNIKEQELTSLQNEQAVLKQKLKSIDQIYKLEYDKLKDELENVKYLLQNETLKNEELSTNNNELSLQLNKLKYKSEYLQEKQEKDHTNLKGKFNMLQNSVTNYEKENQELLEHLNKSRISQKELQNKIQYFQINVIKYQANLDKLQRELAILQDKCQEKQNWNQKKYHQNQIIKNQKIVLEEKVEEQQNRIFQLSTKNNENLNEKNKISKVLQLMQEELKKQKLEKADMLSKVSQKQKQIQFVLSELKKQRQLTVQLTQKYSNLQRQTQKVRLNLNENLNRMITLTDLTQISLENNNTESKHQDKFISNKCTINQMIDFMINHSKNIRNSFTRLAEKIKLLQKNNQKMYQENKNTINQYVGKQQILYQDIENYKNEINQIQHEKQEEIVKYEAVLEEFNQRFKQKQIQIEEFINQNEELNFTINSLKLEFQNQSETLNKKLQKTKNQNQELEDKIQNFILIVAELEEKNNIIQGQYESLGHEIENQIVKMQKKDKNIEELKQNIERISEEYEKLNKIKKKLEEQIKELDMHLGTERQINLKANQSIEMEESKNNQLKIFIANLMKQKQTAIKSQLEKNDEINILQNKIHQTLRNKQFFELENQKNVKNNELLKEQIKKLNQNIKDLSNEIHLQTNKATKMQQKIKQKDKQLQLRDSQKKSIEERNQKNINKLKNQIKHLQDEIQQKNRLNFTIQKDENERISCFQRQIEKKNEKITVLSSKIIEMQQQLFIEKQKNLRVDDKINNILKQNNQLKSEKQELIINAQNLYESNKIQEQKLFQISDKNYNLEMRIQHLEISYQEKFQAFNNDWVGRYEAVCFQYDQKIEFIEKEKQYLKGLNLEKDKEISKINHQIKVLELSQNNTKKVLEDKIKKIEQDRLSLIASKNVQIQRLTEEVKQKNSTIKISESELRRLTNELEIARKTIVNLDEKAKEYDQKIKGINKFYHSEMEQLKKKQTSYKSFKEAVSNHQWNTERQIKRNLQNFMRTLLELNSDNSIDKLRESAKALEVSLNETIAQRVDLEKY